MISSADCGCTDVGLYILHWVFFVHWPAPDMSSQHICRCVCGCRALLASRTSGTFTFLCHSDPRGYVDVDSIIWAPSCTAAKVTNVSFFHHFPSSDTTEWFIQSEKQKPWITPNHNQGQESREGQWLWLYCSLLMPHICLPFGLKFEENIIAIPF